MNRGDDKKYSQSATVFMKNKSQSSFFFHFHNSRRKKSFQIKTVKQCINEAVILERERKKKRSAPEINVTANDILLTHNNQQHKDVVPCHQHAPRTKKHTTQQETDVFKVDDPFSEYFGHTGHCRDYAVGPNGISKDIDDTS
jgi:hypothetical protein